MYLVQITITDVDKDEVIETSSCTAEEYSKSYFPGGSTLTCGVKRQGNGAEPGGWSAALLSGFAGLRAIAERASAMQAQAAAQPPGVEERKELPPTSGGCCGQ